ncbi:MAG: hypothetical protein DMG06_22310 [Acidobacteria bacterium]|nr:MAG: hypothetical protein DMG06_22310 [Acidobacteriota bacterium]
MKSKSRKTRLERRTSDRLSDPSMVLVNGCNLLGSWFSETTRVNDVSRDGISFQLSTLIGTDVILDLRIGPEENEGGLAVPWFEVKARVLRVSRLESDDSRNLVAAKFEGQFVQLAGAFGTAVISTQLQQAVEWDERMRHRQRFRYLPFSEVSRALGRIIRMW